MEANFFNYALLELEKIILNKRIQKVFSPAPDFWTLDLGQCGYLILHISARNAFFYLSASKPRNPAQPDAKVMWFRKRLKNRRIIHIASDWSHRRMAFVLSPGQGNFLIIDLKNGLELTDSLPGEFDNNPIWPDQKEVEVNPRIWEKYPQITPPLRHFYSKLTAQEQKDFYLRLSRSEADKFCIYQENRRSYLLCWDYPSMQGDKKCFESALEAAKHYFAPFISSISKGESQEEQNKKKAVGRLKRSLKKVEQDHERLLQMVALQDQACLLQNNLSCFPPETKTNKLQVKGEQGSAELSLNPLLTLSENMQKMFARAKKGRRGLQAVAQRKEYLQDQLQAVLDSGPVVAMQPNINLQPKSELPKKYRVRAVAVYRLAKGWILIRGKNQEANHKLLSQLASPFDYWFHAQDGPGAHLILKRDFDSQQVDEESLEQAASLAALYSYQKQEKRGKVICALVRDVRKIKGAALGQVAVDKVLSCLLVEVRPELEQLYRLENFKAK